MRFSIRTTILFILMGTVLAGCAVQSEHMLTLKETPGIVTAPPADKATMVFYRSSPLGGAVQASVFDISGDKTELVGIVSSGTKIAYTISPGSSRFMVIGESADFLDVNAAAGKVYYSLVAPRFGVWKARFSLKAKPVTDPSLSEELAQCKWVQNTKSAKDWASANMSSVLEKQNEYIGEWLQKPNRPILNPQDGR